MRQRRYRPSLGFWLALWAWGVLGAVPPSPAPQPLVILVSWDGAKADVVQRLVQQNALPTLARMVKTGAYTFEAQTILPSKTLPSHTSMLTGVSPSVHGILWNRYEPEKGVVQVPTVFEIAKNHGYRTAMVFAKSKFQHLVRPGSVDTAVYVRGDAPAVMATALQVMRTLRPHLIFIHLPDPDHTGHRYGWGNEKKGVPPSPQFERALEHCDEALGQLVDSLKAWGWWPNALVVVTADHGGHDRTHGSADPEDVHIPWIAAGGRVPAKGKIERAVRTMDTAATALEALGIPVPKNWEGRPVISLKPLQSPVKAAE